MQQREATFRDLMISSIRTPVLLAAYLVLEWSDLALPSLQQRYTSVALGHQLVEITHLVALDAPN